MDNTVYKRCSHCGGFFPIEEIRSNGYCRKCGWESDKNYRRTKKGMVPKMHSTLRGNSKIRGDVMPDFSAKELREWLFAQPLFHELYNDWKNSDYKKELKPSIDRLNDYEPYTFSNIQLMTWAENKAKGYADRKSGKNGKVNKAVVQLTRSGKLVNEYHSIKHAGRINNISDAMIVHVCKGRIKSAGGYVWMYKSDYLNL